MALFSSFLLFDALQIHYIVPIKHSVDTEKQLGMTLLQAFFSPPHLPPPLCLFWRLTQHHVIVPVQGGTLDFKWQGRLNGGKYRNHPKSQGLQTKKSLEQTIPTPPPPEKKNPMPNSPTIKISRGTTQLRYYAGTITNLQIVLNTPQSPY